MRRVLTTFVVLAALLAPTAPVLAQYPPDPGDCVITVRSQVRGRFIRIVARARCADVRVLVQFFLESQATYLGSTTSGGDGSYDSGDLLVPPNTPPGQHTVRAVTTRDGNRVDYTTPMTVESDNGNAASGNQTTAAGAPLPPGNGQTTSGGTNGGSSGTGANGSGVSGTGAGGGGVAGTGTGTGVGGTGVGGTGTGVGGTAAGTGTTNGGAPGGVGTGSTVGGPGGSGGSGSVGGVGRAGTGIPGLGAAGAAGAGGNLPTTGADIALLVMWAALILGAGTLLVSTTWRRLHPATVNVRPKPLAERAVARGFDHAFSADLRSVVPGTPVRGNDAAVREEPVVRADVPPAVAASPAAPSDPVTSLQDEIRSWLDDDAN